MRKLLYFLAFCAIAIVLSTHSNSVLSQIIEAERDQNNKQTRLSGSIQKSKDEIGKEYILGKLSCETGQPVEVEATLGSNVAGYNNLGSAFSAINSGIHSGNINIEICSNVSEGTSPATLNSSGAGSAQYSSVTIYPLSDGVTISGSPGQGFGLIQFNGSDNVILDGDNPNTTGINRNLSFQNGNGELIAFSPVIRIATSTAVLTADNITVRNLILNGNATGRNIASVAGTSTSANTSSGIYIAGGAGTTATATPVAITNITASGMPANGTVNNLTIDNNQINRCGRGVVFFGTEVTHTNSTVISNNVIGSPTEGDVTGVYSKGIAVNGGSGVVIRSNLIFVESFLSASLSGIELGIGSAGNVGSSLIEKNIISRVKNNRLTTTGAYGLSLDRGNGHSVANNFISGVINSQGSSGGDFGLTNSAVGIRIADGNNHQILHNSVHLYGNISGTAGNNMTAAFGVNTASRIGMDVRNNIFSNQTSGGGTNLSDNFTVHTVLALPSGTSPMNMNLNNNAYYQGSNVNSRLAKRGFFTNIESEDLFIASNFNSGSISPASNLRSFTEGLRSGGANDNASYATTSVPPFVSNSNLHLLNAQGTIVANNGISTSIIDDIDGNLRGPFPDIGADEIMPPTSAVAGIGGKVVTGDGRGISGAVLTISGGNLIHQKTAITNPFGFYRFEGLEAGQTYIVTVGSKRYLFSTPTRSIELLDNINGYDFIAEPR